MFKRSPHTAFVSPDLMGTKECENFVFRTKKGK